MSATPTNSGGGLAFTEALRTALAEIRAHWLRSGLILVSVVLGTMTMVLLVSLIEAVKVMVWEGVRGLGFDGVMFVSGRAPEDPLEAKKQGYSRGMTRLDAAMLSDQADSLEAVAAVRITESIVRVRGEQRRTRIYGITPSYAAVHGRSVQAGRWLDEGDELESRRVAVLGCELAEKLFGSDDPLGKQVVVGDTPFRVIGVEARLGNRFANSGWSRREMNAVLVPLGAFRAYLQGGEQISFISVKTADAEHLSEVKGEIERTVRRSHRGISDFEVENVADEILRAEKEVRVMLRNWTIVLASIASIALLVGGVGIYSVLRISLAERLYEIGLRKAMGASDGAVLVQFLVESLTLSGLGALAGCGLGAVFAALLSGLFEAGMPVAPLGLGLAISFAGAVGLFAGLFPALSASRMTPVQALTA